MDDIFTEINSDVTIDQNADYLAELVGEGKKFKTPHELAKGKAEADRYIELLKQQNAQLQQEVNTRTSLDSFKTILEGSRQPAEPVNPAPVTPDDALRLDETRLEQLVQNLLAKQEAQRAQESNSQKVSRVLEENFGQSAQQVINQKAKDLGMSLEALKSLSTQAPNAFFALVGAQEGNQRPVLGGAVPRSSVSMGDPTAHAARGKSYYDKMKRENPKQYNDQRTTVQMMNDMQQLGRDKFNSI